MNTEIQAAASEMLIKEMFSPSIPPLFSVICRIEDENKLAANCSPELVLQAIEDFNHA
jgi:hypothetical protein